MTTNRTDAKVYEVINPATGGGESRYEARPPAQVEEALSNASDAYREWQNTTSGQRAELMHAVGRELRSEIDAQAVKRFGYGREFPGHGSLEFINVKAVWIS